MAVLHLHPAYGAGAGADPVSPEAALWMMLVPSLSQDVLVTSLMKGAALNGVFVLISIISTLVAGLLLTWLAAWLYRREKVLG